MLSVRKAHLRAQRASSALKNRAHESFPTHFPGVCGCLICIHTVVVDVAAAARVKAEISEAGEIWKDLKIWTFSLPPDRHHDAFRRASSDVSGLLSNLKLNFLDGVGGGGVRRPVSHFQTPSAFLLLTAV